MDGARFDYLARSLTTTCSRRRALTAAFAGAVGLHGLAHPADTKADGKCKSKCGECQTCKKGDCKKKNGNKVCKKGKCKARAFGTSCSGGTCQRGSCVAAAAPPVVAPPAAAPPLPPPTCTDNIKNGSETGVDCGGTCPRCANGQGCANHNDCAGALCSAGTCGECSATPNTCGTESDGTSCTCAFAAQINASVCLRIRKPVLAPSCAECPPDTICFPNAGTFECAKRCGAP